VFVCFLLVYAFIGIVITNYVCRAGGMLAVMQCILRVNISFLTTSVTRCTDQGDVDRIEHTN